MLFIVKNQHGFCKRRSCLTNLWELSEKVRKHVDLLDIIYLDFQKIFEKKLLTKDF